MKGKTMPRGNKSAYSDKQKRQVKHIEEGYAKHGVSDGEAAARAWATENKMSGGGRVAGSGRGQTENNKPSRKESQVGGQNQSHVKRVASGKKAATTRRRRAA